MKESKIYNLEERTFQLAKRVRLFAKEIPYSVVSNDDIKQVIKSSGSVGANYIEANEKLSDKDFNFRIKICRKEAKETGYWLRLIKETNDLNNDRVIEELREEIIELRKIFSAILKKRS